MDLSDDEKRRAAAQVDYFLSLVAERYNVKPDEVLEAVRWVRERKAFTEKVKSTGLVSLIGLVISAISMTVWEGVKAMMQRGN